MLTDVLDDMTVDSALTVERLRDLFAAAQSIGPDNFVAYDLSGAVANAVVDGTAVLELDERAAAGVVQAFLTGDEPQPANSANPTDDAALSGSACP